jgi:hypothetical protein
LKDGKVEPDQKDEFIEELKEEEKFNPSDFKEKIEDVNTELRKA